MVHMVFRADCNNDHNSRSTEVYADEIPSRLRIPYIPYEALFKNIQTPIMRWKRLNFWLRAFKSRIYVMSTTFVIKVLSIILWRWCASHNSHSASYVYCFLTLQDVSVPGPQHLYLNHLQCANAYELPLIFLVVSQQLSIFGEL